MELRSVIVVAEAASKEESEPDKSDVSLVKQFLETQKTSEQIKAEQHAISTRQEELMCKLEIAEELVRNIKIGQIEVKRLKEQQDIDECKMMLHPQLVEFRLHAVKKHAF